MRNIFKIASLLAAAVMLFACEQANTSGELKIVSDKDVIQADGQDAAVIRVMYGSKDVTASSVIYDQYDKEVTLVDGKFTATKTGDYKFYADYGAMSTYRKNDSDCYFVIKAINVAVPESPADHQPQSTSFVHRAFLTQYTGTGCGYCPLMIKVLREVAADKLIPDKAIHAAVHSYQAGDPAYISAPRVSNYPFLTVDLVQGFNAENGVETLKTLINEHTQDAAKAGIAVSSKYYKKESLLVVKVAVKAADAGEFNVGAWLLEDDIYGQQSDYNNVGDESYNTHENCVRIADSKYSSTWFGHHLGALEAGDVAEKTFVMNISSSWKVENLHLAVFASHGVAEGSTVAYKVCNAVDVPIDAETPFEYAK
jgi:hypothetical protein